MLNVSKLLFADRVRFPGDNLRYGTGRPHAPVVVWHLTDRCNLSCRHCYAAAADSAAQPMNTEEAEAFLGFLASFRPHTLLLSGGEPLMHPDFFAYLAKARAEGLNVSVSTNGTLIDDEAARQIAQAGCSYVGVSLDGPRELHDAFRGVAGAFDAAGEGIERLAFHGCRVGLRVTLAAPLLPRLDAILRLAERLPVSRICFYHFVPSGRGAGAETLMPDLEVERRAIRRIFQWTERHGPTCGREVLTVGDASDGALLYRFLQGAGEAERAERAGILLRRAAARKIGAGIRSVRWDGVLFANQFSWNQPLGGWRDLGTACPGEEDELAEICPPCAWRLLCSGSLRRDTGHGCMLTEEERGNVQL